MVSPSTGYGAAREALFAGENQCVDFARHKLVQGELCFQKFPSLDVSHYNVTPETFGVRYGGQKPTSSHGAFRMLRQLEQGHMYCWQLTHVTYCLGQQAGIQLLCFPLDSSAASSLAFRMETMRTDRVLDCSHGFQLVPALPSFKFIFLSSA